MFDYVTAIGLDVHARSISACAFDPMTGEVVRARFGYDPASVAEWALGFESPKAVYESGPTGFHLCRALRALGVDWGAPRPRPLGGHSSSFFWAAGDRRARHKTAMRPEAPSRSNEMRFRPADIRVPNARRADTPSSGASTG